jgi:hypothetical protein
MYLITPHSSETGKRFEALIAKMKACHEAQRELAKQLGFDQWRGGNWTVDSGISSCIFKEAPDPKIWRNVNGYKNEWMPRGNTKAGKELRKLFDALPVIHRVEVNECIGWHEGPFRMIGFDASSHPQFIGIKADEDWNIPIPKDCQEITTSRYNKIFNKEQK